MRVWLINLCEKGQGENLVTEWGPGLTAEKVPTVLRYENGGTSGIAYWGFDAVSKSSPVKQVHEWFKLGLCPELEESRAAHSELLRKYPSKVALPPVSQDKCEKLVIDYLLRLKGAVDRLFASMTDDMVNYPREYIITVPAMWSHGAQETMRKCAAEAFLGDRRLKENLQMVAEPEAAGIYALTSMQEIGLEKDDTFVICDAGGGTVDLSSYKITSMEDFIGLRRVSTISGELCGSSFLNRIFEDYLTKRPELAHVDWTARQNMRLLRAAVNEFETTIKPQFTGNETGAFYLTTPLPVRRPSDDGSELAIPVKDIREKVFDLVISKICSLVRDQIKDTVAATGSVKRILLAGGFGRNTYLERRVQQEVGDDIKVRRVDNSPTAIVRGALMAGLTKAGATSEGYTSEEDVSESVSSEGAVHSGEEQQKKQNKKPKRLGKIYARKPARVTAREAPRHYGTRIYEEVDNGSARKNGRNRKTSGSREVEVMKWFVKKGDEILDGEPKTFRLRYEVYLEPWEERSVIYCDVYSHKADKPPSRPHTAARPVPSLETPLATLTIDLRTIDSLPYEVEEDGRHHYDVAFEVYMTLNSAELTFNLGRGKERYKPATVTVNESEWLS
ncbi:hypothetical protein JDV02_009014 [Purpureocillium takamizusanense]|uniref:Uncharacterized protein n=1 Tax=Purpureocillium takamizusanense TaxID=2060973 RepID=A0A9Q8VFR3_9HYPO|nr:uncharacterized protein JDV02_009014 [Purpureocillium takamizusanense]UNI23179.1 hypothetical protein JDV02_009014 [Purpureocillium takamizusanense]